MQPFPFRESEWQRIQNASCSLVKATLENDSVLRASLLAELMAVLEEIRQEHGEHPILLETAADFCDDPVSQLDLYRSAIRLAEASNLPTLTIRLSLASLLLEDFDDPRQAAKELKACKSEVTTDGDVAQRQEWSELMGRCGDGGSSADP